MMGGGGGEHAWFVGPTGGIIVEGQLYVPVTTGRGGTECWTFEAASTATATLSMRYRRPWETVPPARTKQFTVIVRPAGAPAQVPRL
jgi:Chagasin family peptidase inhibitor I42